MAHIDFNPEAGPTESPQAALLPATQTRVVSRARDLRRRTARDVVRRVALDVLSWWESCRSILAAPCSARVQFLLLHHVFDDETATFRALLSKLRQRFRFIGYSEAVERILENRIDDTYLAVSFDDGLKCCRRAAEVLEEFGASACFFVCPRMIGETDDVVIEMVCRRRLCHPAVDFLNWDDVEELLDRGHEFGGHTMNHVNLGGLPVGLAAEEIGNTYQTLAARLGEVKHFAWPYGRFQDVNLESVRAVFAAGFHSCASGVRGCHGSVLPGESSRRPAATTNRPGRRRQMQLFVAPGASEQVAPERLCVRRESMVAGWPLSHVLYFLRRSARRPLPIDETWPPALRLIPTINEGGSCTSRSTPYPSTRAAG